MTILGLTAFGLTPTRLRRLGDRPVEVSVQQRRLPIASLRPLRPARRQTRLGNYLQHGLEHLRARWPQAGFTARGNGKLPWTLDGVVPARAVARLAATRGVEHVFVNQVKGLRPRRSDRELRWFCLWGRVAIQVEGKRKGMIDIEDRLVVVKAKSEREAEAKLSRQWRDYAEPYLNPYGELVRWKLTEIRDIYELSDDEIDPRGTEVYSRIRKRKMKASDPWISAK